MFDLTVRDRATILERWSRSFNLRVRARYRRVTIVDINIASGAFSEHRNENGIFIVLLFSSRMIFICGRVSSTMTKRLRKNPTGEERAGEKEREMEKEEEVGTRIKTLKINSRYPVCTVSRRS